MNINAGGRLRGQLDLLMHHGIMAYFNIYSHLACCTTRCNITRIPLGASSTVFHGPGIFLSQLEILLRSSTVIHFV